MILWRPFSLDGFTYDLSHLHPRIVTFTQKESGEKPKRVYEVQVTFSLHCFTRSRKAGEEVKQEQLYSDSRESRIFDLYRYRMSRLLPEIVDNLALRKCYHTEKGNFFVVEVVTESGKIQEYEVYFLAAKSKNSPLTLFVQSAYVRDTAHKKDRPRKKPIGLHVILYNTLTNKAIKVPPY